MRFEDIPAEQFSIRMKPAVKAENKLKEQAVRVVSPSSADPCLFDLTLASSVVAARPTDAKRSAQLLNELAMGRAAVAQLANVADDGSFDLFIKFFSGTLLDMGEIDVGLDEVLEANYRKLGSARNELSISELGTRLSKDFCYEQNGEHYFFMLAGTVVEDDLAEAESLTAQENADTTADDDGSEAFPVVAVPIHLETPIAEEPRKTTKFCVANKKMSFVAAERPLEDGRSVFVATKLTEKRNKADKALRLAKGKLSFVDWTKAGQIQILAQAQLTNILKDNSSYLKKWDEFGNVEGEILLSDARDFDVIYYHKASQNKDGSTSVQIIDASEYALGELADGRVEEVELVNNEPQYISNPELSFSDFSSGISKQGYKGRASYYKVLKYDEGTRTLVLDAERIQDSGKLVLSLQGEITQIKRRNAARKAILNGRSANPQLGLLLEESGVVTSLRTPSKQQALNAFVRNKIFKNPPTLNQEKAIEVALNTPDIALIQGPPGTGKTTVIAAICERLNQMAIKEGVSVKGQILLTGFQHDAVENMIGRMSLDGMPVPKFGKRSGSDVDDLDVFERSIEEWCDQIVRNLREMNPELAKVDQEKDIEALSMQYIKHPTQALAAALVNKIAAIPEGVLGRELSEKAGRLARQHALRATIYSANNSNLIRSARQIRTRPESFLDDGPERASDALDDLRDVLDSDYKKLLEKASSWDTLHGVPPFLDEIMKLKKSLLTQLTAPPHFRVEKASDEVLDLSKDAIKKIKEKGLSVKEKRLAALAEFLAELEGNFYGTVEAVSDYSFAFAATVQQSAGQKMQEVKGIKQVKGFGENDNTQSIEYEYVIVDEAARVSPRDLMIPMAQGKRIILVGDHRQLPHIIDEEVARQMDNGESEDNETDWLKKSMFEYLFTERLKTLEESDGIPRRVTLDKQFRMHPTLGDFISRNFYERFSAEEKMASGLPESLFTHNLPGTDNRAAAWIDVPEDMGRHSRRGTSWVRQAEADVIANKLIEWISSDQGKELSYGVISFYKAQAELIKKTLGNLNIDDKKLRIGTVDSFQGMEFDVVFLSMVRTLPKNVVFNDNRPSNSESNEQKEKKRKFFQLFSKNDYATNQNVQSVIENPEDKKQAQGLFGHLCLYNRLNVSMSRQKKLLVVVGDQELLNNSLAQRYVPGLVDFHELCQRGGVFLPCR